MNITPVLRGSIIIRTLRPGVRYSCGVPEKSRVVVPFSQRRRRNFARKTVANLQRLWTSYNRSRAAETATDPEFRVFFFFRLHAAVQSDTRDAITLHRTLVRYFATIFICYRVLRKNEFYPPVFCEHTAQDTRTGVRII